MILSYTEMITIPTFDERYAYLRLDGIVGADTFGFDRAFYQKFLQSVEWKSFRDKVILRDTINGYCCDLGCEGYEIPDGTKILIHHLNPVILTDITDANIEKLLNLDNVISTTLQTHNAIHYGRLDSISKSPIERKPNDTCPWR